MGSKQYLYRIFSQFDHFVTIHIQLAYIHPNPNKFSENICVIQQYYLTIDILFNLLPKWKLAHILNDSIASDMEKYLQGKMAANTAKHKVPIWALDFLPGSSGER